MKNNCIFIYITALFLTCGFSISEYQAFASDLELVNAFPNLSFDSPLLLTHANDGSGRVFVVERDGIIHIFQNDSTITETKEFLDIRSRVSAGGEMGLLGLTFHPDFNNNGLFYVYYTSAISGPRRSVISQFSATGDQADVNSEGILLEVDQPFQNHNGGMIEFGADGYLYIAFGDGGDRGDPENHGQNLATLLGAIIRIDVDNKDEGLNYAIPSDNPFVGQTNARGEIFAYGLRNPWRFSFDRQTGQIWCGDVGQNRIEEVDIIEKGKNYGWRIMEGTECFNRNNFNQPLSSCNKSGLTLPIKEYSHSLGCSISGGYVYRGARRPELYGAYIYGDYCTGRIWLLRYEGGTVTADSLLLDTDISIASFGEDEHNDLYVIDLGGTIYRFNGSAPTGVSDNEFNARPALFNLQQNYPNPFNPSTSIRYSIKTASEITIEIYNTLGEKIKTLIRDFHEAGDYEITWDGRDDSGKQIVTGLYIYKMTVGETVITKKMILIK